MIGWIKFLWDTRRCPHARIRGVYGDEIIQVNARLRCLDCHKYLDGGLDLVNYVPDYTHDGPLFGVYRPI